MSFNKDNKVNNGYSSISIGLASPEEILAQSSGEVLKPETINYRTYKPERDGLFCERIFGPVKDYECHCGKYKRIRYKGIVCDRCGVEVTEKKVRRERMGHISLVVPVVHIWYFRSLPSKIGYLLGIPSKKLEAIIYYERYVVINAGAAAEQGVERLQTLSEKEYLDIVGALPKGNQSLDDSDPNKFVAQMGAEAIYTLLQQVDLDSMSYALRHKASTETSQQRKSEALKCLNVIEMFRASEGRNKPEWMVLKVLPVIPPELRPLVPLDGGRLLRTLLRMHWGAAGVDASQTLGLLFGLGLLAGAVFAARRWDAGVWPAVTAGALLVRLLRSRYAEKAVAFPAAEQ